MSALCFTGHRPESLPLGENEMDARFIQLKAMLLTEIMDRAAAKCDTFYCGVASGIDLTYGRLVLMVKATAYPQIKLICVVPHKGQANHWPEKWRDRYFTLLKQADNTVLIADTYTPDCYDRHNRYMVDKSSAVLSVYNELGCEETASTTKYARQQGKELVVIDPATLKRTVIPAQTIESL